MAQPDLRLTAATAAGRCAALASRATGRGSGASIRGKVLLKFDPRSLEKLLAGRQIAAISGTNGKTTTTHLLAAALREGRPDEQLVTNADGANLRHGIASALSGTPPAGLAVLETDERVVADVVRVGRPEVLVLLNLSRDQLDRHHEVKRLAAHWRAALAAAGAEGPTVVASTNEPLIVWACRDAHRVVWVDTGGKWTNDATLCPQCGSLLDRAECGAAPAWACSECELAQPPADIRVRGNQICTDRQVWQTALHVPGQFNVGNAACALAAAIELGATPEAALRGMASVTAPAGRFAITELGAATARLMLAKNPAGWAEVLPLARTPAVVLAIDSAAADGRDVSWLWDVEFEQLRDRLVIAAGPRARDLAVRLAYADVEHRCIPNLAQALRGHHTPIDVIATYTPFQKLRRMAGV